MTSNKRFESRRNVERCFSDVTINAGARVSDSVILPGAYIGSDCHLSRTIVDQRCVIPRGTVVGEDAQLYTLSPGGIVLVSSSDCGLPVVENRYRVAAIV